MDYHGSLWNIICNNVSYSSDNLWATKGVAYVCHSLSFLKCHQNVVNRILPTIVIVQNLLDSFNALIMVSLYNRLIDLQKVHIKLFSYFQKASVWFCNRGYLTEVGCWREPDSKVTTTIETQGCSAKKLATRHSQAYLCNLVCKTTIKMKTNKCLFISYSSLTAP